jgi:flagellar biosynthetic protein FliR
MLALEILWGAGLALAVAVVFTLARLVVLWTGHTATAGLLTLTPAQGETSDAAWRALAGWLAVLAFLGAGGHLLVVAALRESFAVMPVAMLPAVDSLRSVGESAGWLFATGAALALPLLALALLIQLAFFVLARTTPGLDMFSMGLGLAAVGLLAAWVVAVPVIARGMSDGLAQMSLWFAALTGVR